MSGLAEPPSLRDFLAAGCRLEEVPDLNLRMLALNVMQALDKELPERLDMAIQLTAECADMLAGNPKGFTQADLIEESFAAEIWWDPALARRVGRVLFEVNPKLFRPVKWM